MSWGYKILIFYSAFVIGMLYMVFKSSSQKMDLVTTDYYAKELVYQEKIDEINRANALTEEIRYTVDDNVMTVTLPKDFTGKQVSGTVDLYCPSDAKKDLVQKFTGNAMQIKLPITKSTKGMYELQVTWQADNLKYYYKKKIFI
jgi:hypothetical protein